MKKLLLISFLSLALLTCSQAQVYNPVKWHFSSEQLSENTYELLFEASIDDGWHMYGLTIPEGGPIATSFHFNEVPDVEFLGKVKPDKNPEVKFDPTFEIDVELFDKKALFKQKIRVQSAGPVQVDGFVEFMACDDTKCLPPKEADFSFQLAGKDAPTGQPEKGPEKKTTQADKEDLVIDTTGVDSTDDTFQEGTVVMDQPVEETGEGKGTRDSLLRLFFIALLAGFGALLTPCVYPIIPLTVSFFMRDTGKAKAIFNGLFFGLSIVFIYTLVGFIVGLTKVDLVRLVSSHWLPNLIFFLIFLVLAFSFFGMFEITLPGSLSNKIDNQADKGGFLGPFFMALATVVISFSCTGPIVGVVLGSALQGEVLRPVVGMLGFSISFALPFTLLAIFPGFMKSLPKSGGWLNSVKVFFAFILLAFSLIFVTNLGLDFITRDVILSVLIVIFLLLGIYLLGFIKFSHDSEVKYISVPRLLLAIVAFSFAVYLIPGLFGAPLKTISPFLPAPDENRFALPDMPGDNNLTGETKGNVCNDSPRYSDFLHLPHQLVGYFDYEEALACAKQLNKPVLLDFAGHSCKNCKKMYAEVWSDSRVLEKLRNDFVIAALYTDDRTKLPESEWVTSDLDGKVKKTIGKKFNDLQVSKFGSNALPLYAVVDPDGKILTTEKYYTYSPEVEPFIRFLNEGIRNFKNN
ncbi:MAG: cytochrome c biogenesis protein CcdA [Bacteroidales bacterium]|jgi:thiol:disulfide interchange protein DsbD